MPSWNIHIAHYERLRAEVDLASYGIASPNAFLFGNVLPDVYVGYMVPDASMRIDYRLTHVADSAPIPLPKADKFWDLYAESHHWDRSELILGAWAHLVCDHVYNRATREFLAREGIRMNSGIRARKQGDFALFGRTLPISAQVEATDELVEACRTFPQYRILEPDVHRAVRAANAIVERNASEHIEGVPEYSLLGQQFFLDTFERVHEELVLGLERARA